MFSDSGLRVRQFEVDHFEQLFCGLFIWLDTIWAVRSKSWLNERDPEKNP